MSSRTADNPVLVEVARGGVVESVHRARVAITDADGSLAAALGSASAPIYPRSAVKPLQAVGMLRAGLDARDELLALVAASHSGEDFHIDGVRRILGSVGLDESALQTPPSYPLDSQAMIAWVRAGYPELPVAMNCSGKHAGMIAAAASTGERIDTYRDPGHPVQRAIHSAIGDLARQHPDAVTIDGCGAPLYAIDLPGLARAFGRLAAADEGPEARVAAAIRGHPEYTSGTRRDEYQLHCAIPGLVTKGGAEAVQAIGLPGGRGIALKIDDGGSRARPVLAAAVLQQLGYDHPTLTEHAAPPVLGHGEPVGEVRPARPVLSELTRS
jgi:L-asparaginase II